MIDNTYNGWTNRETWLINLHFEDFFAGWDSESIQDYVEEMAQDESINIIMKDFLMGAIARVNWNEIAEANQ